MNADITLKNVEPNLISQAEKVFSEIGLSLNDAVKYFLRASVKLNTLPPGIEEENFNAETLAALQEAEDIASGKIQAKRYNSFEELMAEIDAEIAAEDAEQAKNQATEARTSA